MESTISYIIIIVIIILSVTVYNYRKKQTRSYKLSVQRYSEANLTINIRKQQGKIDAVIINLTSTKNQQIKDIRVELISKKREFNYYHLLPIIENYISPTDLKTNETSEFIIPFDAFKSLLMDGEYPFRTFRFVVITVKEQYFKSHEMGFNKKWIIYRPDTGKYN